MNDTYPAFRKTGIDLAPLGMGQRPETETYFCTPRGARIFGWAGVDGIHFCFIRGFGEMVFAVSPMNLAPHYVHPLARNFSDVLRLLLACGDSAALEQAWQWNAEQFAAFLAENPPTKEQQTVLDQIAAKTGLAPMEEPWQYLHALQAGFDYSKIKYTEEFYDLDLNPDAPRPPAEWKVFFDGTFRGHSGRGRAGTELAVRADFRWAGRRWLIPSVYLCGRGLVVDFCMQVEASDIRAFLEAWDLSAESEAEPSLSREQRMQLELDNPMCLEFRPTLRLNGAVLTSDHGCGTVYNPCLSGEYSVEDEARLAMEHYGLDPNFGWMIQRSCFPWATKRRAKLRTLSVTMAQDPAARPGPHIQLARPGDTAVFSYGGREHTLTVQEYEAQTIDWSPMPDAGLERPSHYIAMSYTVTPELPDGVLTLADCEEGDRPRQTPSAPDQPAAASCATVMGIIGGADGPSAVLYGRDRSGKPHAACSSLRFKPVESVEWRLVFHEKQFEDQEISLIPNAAVPDPQR